MHCGAGMERRFEMNRRALLTGLASLVAAPALVRASSLMPISGEVYRIWQYSMPILPPIDGIPWSDNVATQAKLIRDQYLGPNGRLYEGTWTYFGKHHNIYSDKVIAFEKREYA